MDARILANKVKELQTIQIGDMVLEMNPKGQYVPVTKVAEGQPLEVKYVEETLSAVKVGDGETTLSRIKTAHLVPVDEQAKRAEWERQKLRQVFFARVSWLLNAFVLCVAAGLIAATYTFISALWESRHIAGAMISEAFGTLFTVIIYGGGGLLFVALIMSARQGIKNATPFESDETPPATDAQSGGDTFITIGRNSSIHFTNAQNDLTKR